MKAKSKLYFVRNAAALRDPAAEVFKEEYEVVTDADVTGELRYGPYELIIWDLANRPPGFDRKLCLRVKRVRERVEAWPEGGSGDGFYHGGGIPHELVTLSSLFLRRRLKLGPSVRFQDRPVMLEVKQTVAPALLQPCANLADAAAELQLVETLRSECHLRFMLAARLYHQALLDIEAEPELAYLLLVSAIEAVCQDAPISTPALADVDAKLAALLVRIGDPELRGAIEGQVLGRERFIKRRFVRFVLDHLDDAFWQRAGRPDPGLLRVERTDMERLLGVIYVQRSRTLHDGERFPPTAFTSPVHRAEIDGSVRVQVGDGKFWIREDYVPLVSFFELVVNYALRAYLRKNQIIEAAGDISGSADVLKSVSAGP